MQSIEFRVKKIISDQLECDISYIGDDTFFYAIGTNQIDINKLVMLLENEFHILILDEDMKNFINVRTVINYINGHWRNQGVHVGRNGCSTSPEYAPIRNKVLAIEKTN